MSKPVVEVQVRAVAAVSAGCAVFLGNEDKVFVMFVDQSRQPGTLTEPFGYRTIDLARKIPTAKKVRISPFLNFLVGGEGAPQGKLRVRPYSEMDSGVSNRVGAARGNQGYSPKGAQCWLLAEDINSHWRMRTLPTWREHEKTEWHRPGFAAVRPPYW
jgi:hypothetical protein